MKIESRLPLVIALIVAAALPAIAQKKDLTSPQQDAARGELRTALTNWAKAEVIPQLLEWKHTLDGAMSAADLDALNRLRARATALRTEFIANALEMRKAWKDEDYTALKGARDRMKELASARTALMQELKPLAVSYRSTLESIGGQAKPRVAEWKAKGKEIVKGWAASRKDGAGDMPMWHGRAPFDGKMGMWKTNEEMRKKIMVARFMLWDGGEPAYPTDDIGLDDMPELN